MNDAERRHKAKVAKHEVVEKPEFTISKEDEERLVELFSRMPCDMSEPEMTPEQRAAYERQEAQDKADDDAFRAMMALKYPPSSASPSGTGSTKRRRRRK
jgi:hypothetical protein